MTGLFRRTFGDDPEAAFFAPGRINLIGEHIDYCGGHVLPCAVSLGITALVKYRGGTTVRLASSELPGVHAVDLSAAVAFEEARGWANYPAGVIRCLADEGRRLRGADVLFSSTLPQGAGLSSSAAIEVLTGALMLHPEDGEGFDRTALALLCQKAENRFVGVACGIMDQFSVAMGKKGHAILLDCATLEHRHVPFEPGGLSLVIMDTGRSRELAGSLYNTRRSECERALSLVRRSRAIANLVEATPEEIEAAVDDPIVRRRARHVVSEERRVQEAAFALERGNLATFASLLDASHASLRDDYEVTGPLLDAIVEEARATGSCAGARMTGAGFGGCAIALVRSDRLDEFYARAGAGYRRRTGLSARFHAAAIDDGARKVPMAPVGG
jgi:galactokinase